GTLVVRHIRYQHTTLDRVDPDQVNQDWDELMNFMSIYLKPQDYTAAELGSGIFSFNLKDPTGIDLYAGGVENFVLRMNAVFGDRFLIHAENYFETSGAMVKNIRFGGSKTRFNPLIGLAGPLFVLAIVVYLLWAALLPGYRDVLIG